MAVFQDEVADAETIVDPPQGITTVTGDFASFNSDPDPLPEYGAPTYIGVSTGSVSGSGTSVSAVMPSGGDVPESGLENIYAIIAYDATVITGVDPDQTGLEPSWTWNVLTSAYAAGGDIGITVYYKRASPPSHIADYPAEAGPFTFTPASGTGEMSMTLVRVGFASSIWNYELNNTADLGTHTSFESYGNPGGLGGGTVSHDVLRLTGFAGALSNTWSASGTTEIADVHSGSWTSLGVYQESMTSGDSYVPRTATASTSVRAVLVDLALYASVGTDAAYSGWVKLELPSPGEFRMNTFGSSMIDTKLALFDHEPAGIDSRGSGALYYNDDVDFSPWWDTEVDWTHSYIPENTEGGTFVLPAGTYWIVVWPYESTDWDTSEGDATLTIERIDEPLPPFDTIAEIVYDGTDITRYVDLAGSSFEMSAGPQPAKSSIKILDRGHSMSFVTGKEMTLDIDGLRVWGGYVMAVRRGYAFPADDTSEPELTPRYFILQCSDYNILFSKRSVRNKAEPADPMPYFDPGVHDDVIIGQLLDDYSDLGSEGFTTDRVDHVGTPAEDMKADLAEPPDMFGDAMKRVAQMPGAIYYFDADKYLVYADVDREDAPFKLSDDPNQSDSFGYRAIGLLKDATSLANDAMVWGAALGVAKFTFERYQDDDSIADHGLWQWADFRQDLYKPESVLKRATSYVDGSTQNNRGHKDNAITIRCTVRKPGLRAGMKVDFESVVHGYHDVIPIRSMRIKFVNPNEALYELRLAHYIDEAWNTAEFRNLPPEDVRICEKVTIDGVACLTATNSAWRDDFDRPDNYYQEDHADPVVLYNDSWGPRWFNVAALEHPWSGGGAYDYDTATGIDSGNAFLSNGDTYPTVINSEALARTAQTGPWNTPAGFQMHARFRFTGTFPVNPQWTFGYNDDDEPGGGFDRWLGDIEAYHDYNTSGILTPSDIDFAFGYNQWVEVRWEYSVTRSFNRIKFWVSGDDEPESWTVNTGITYTTPSSTGFVYFVLNAGGGTEDTRWEFDWISFCQPGLIATTTGQMVPGTATAYDLRGNPLTVIDSGGNTVVISADNTSDDPAFDPDSIKSLIFWGPNSSFYNAPTGGYAPPDDYSLMVAQKSHQPSVGSYSETRTIGTWIMPDGATHARIRGQIVGGSGHYGVLSGGTTEYTISWLLSYTSWDEVGGATEDAGAWSPSGSTISSGTNSTVPTMGDSGDWADQTVLDDVDTTIPVAGGQKVQLHLTLTSDEGVYLTPNIVTGYDGNVITFVEDGSGHASTQSTVAFGAPFGELSVIQALVGHADVGDEVIVCYDTNDVTVGTDQAVGTGGPVYRPEHVRQLGWGSKYDGLNCTMASACIALDRHTEGAKTSNPPLMRSYQSDMVGGTDLHDADDAWNAGYSEDLDVQTDSWATFVSEINSGRGGIVQGDYAQVPNAYSSQLSFNGAHAMYINEFNESGNVLVYDPLATGPRWWPASIIQDYAETYGGGSVQVGYTQVTG